MCVSTVIPKEMENVAADTPAKTLPNKFKKSKEKYIKLHNKMVNPNDDSSNEEKLIKKTNMNKEEQINQDILARSTIFLRVLFSYFDSFKKSTFYTILSSTSQPIHVIIGIAVIVSMSMMFSKPETKHRQQSSLLSFIYLSSFVIHFGSQIWMTFVSGLSLYFALPRHAFGEVQRVLFPRYFTINAILSLITILTFVKYPINNWNTEISVQIGTMIIAFLIELLVRLYLVPPMMHLMCHKIALERAAGIGKEVGRFSAGPLNDCPHYLRIHQSFRKLHMVIAIGNILTMACTVSHLYYISSKLPAL